MNKKATYKTSNSKLLLDEDEDGVKLGAIPKDLEKEIQGMDEPDSVKDQLRKLARLKNLDIIKEITSEYERKGNFVRIYPSRGGEIYEKYFQH